MTRILRSALCLWLVASSVLLLAQVPPAPQAPAARQMPDAIGELSTSLEALVRHVSRCVVQVFSTGYSIQEDSESTNASLLTRQQSTGSGIILSADGYIVTNSHVVQGARRVRVQLPASRAEVAQRHSVVKPEGRTVDAKIVGIDRESDLAVLKIDRTGLQHLTLGNSELLHQGQLVMAFGNPLGLENSVSMGIVSSMARQVKPDDPMIYIQTDASINPGNSGGPLVDTNGRVVGINTFILSQSGGSEGLGFAIPSNIVRTIYTQIRKDGHVHRGQIGVIAQSITPALAKGLGLAQDWGVIVADVTPDGPADKAGMKIGDIVVNLDGKVMENARQFQVNIYGRPLGDKIKLEVLRGADHLSVDVAVVERNDDPQRFADLVNPENNLLPKLGILGVEITSKIAEMVDDLRVPSGIVVAAVASHPPYSGPALHAGDIIHAVNGVPVTSITGLRSALETVKVQDTVVLQIERDSRLSFVTIEIE